MHSLKVSKCSSRQAKQTSFSRHGSRLSECIRCCSSCLCFNATVFSEAACRWQDNAAALNIKLFRGGRGRGGGVGGDKKENWKQQPASPPLHSTRSSSSSSTRAETTQHMPLPRPSGIIFLQNKAARRIKTLEGLQNDSERL